MAARGAAAFAAGVLIAAGLVIVSPASVAQADEPLPVDDPTTAVTADALPTAQINGVAWDQVVVGNTVYVGGQFTSARPAGSASGTNESARYNLMSYNLTTGVMTSWAPNVNGRIRVITASPDGTRIYIGGAFTSVNGVGRSRIAAFNTSDGSLVSGFAPVVNSDVFALTASNSTVYLGGWFTAVNNVARTRLAAATASNGALTGWAPTADYTVYGLGLTGAGDRVVAAGSFQTLNGTTSVSMGSLDAVSGVAYPFVAGTLLRNVTDNAAMDSLKVVGSKAYSTGFGYGVGNFEGALVADAYTGAIDNMLDCHGDTYDSVPMNGVVYSVSHHHTCDNVGSFPEVSPRRWQRTDAFTQDARGTVAANNQSGAGYGNWAGQPVGSMVNWFPDLTIGTYTGAGQAAWTVETGGSYLVEGGEFLSVNGTAQQGLVRFATRSVVTNPKVGPAGTADELTPTLYQRTSTATGGSFRASWDRDGTQLSYRVIRADKGVASPVATITATSLFWQRPVLDFVDNDVVPGFNYRYYILASDADQNTLQGTSASITPVSTGIGVGYPAGVMADAPSHYWRLGQAAGAATSPDQASARSLTLLSAVTGGVGGALNGSTDTAAAFAGSLSGRAATSVAEPGPQTFSLELWFSTTSASGGKLFGFGNSSTGTSSSYDRHLYLDNAGHLTFGVYNGAARTVTTERTYNDGAWHHVVATLSATGMVLYVDGVQSVGSAQATSAQAFDGYWRLGGDALGSWPNSGSSDNFAGTLDEVAVYPTALSAARVLAHYTAGITPQPVNQPPTASFVVTTTALTASLDASGSTDPDGTVASYGWDFGDGARGSGRTTSHAYATAGTYTVKLVVIDNLGTATSTIRAVSVGAGGGQVIAKDAFNRTQSRWGTADVGGAWTDSGASYYSTDGTHGVITISSVGSGPSARLGSVNAAGVEVVSDLALNKVPAGGAYLYQALARINGSTSYKMVIRFETTGAVRVYLARVLSGSETLLKMITYSSFGYSAGEQLDYRFSATGTSPTTLAASVWRATDTEPANPQLTVTDSTTGLQAAGAVGITSYASSAVTNAPIVATVDNYVVVAPGSTGGDNQAPVAAFTSTVSDLTVSVDGSGSADAEGPVSAWAWTFGDGGTATGATAQHTYAAAGTYTVTLTVTDSVGATGSTSRSVSVVAPAATYAGDDFARTVASGWGSADVGGSWTPNVASSFSTDGTAGLVRMTATNSTRSAYLNAVSAADVVETVELSLDQAPVGDSYYQQVLARVNGNSLYSLTARFLPTGGIYLILARVVSGTETQLKSVTLGDFGYGSGESIRIRFSVTGSTTATLGASVWKVGTSEPATPQLSTTDATASLQAAGAVGLRFYTAPALTSVPLTVRVESYRATGP